MDPLTNRLSPSRIGVCLLVLGMGLLHLIIAFGNLTDYSTNFAFVTHVLSMDTIFPGSRVHYRAINEEWLHHTAYAFIIGLEMLIAYFFLNGAVHLFSTIHKSPPEFQSAKKNPFWGVGLGLILWLLVFSVFGAEWFSMWQSSQWNGIASAHRNLLLILATYALLLLVH